MLLVGRATNSCNKFKLWHFWEHLLYEISEYAFKGMVRVSITLNFEMNRIKQIAYSHGMMKKNTRNKLMWLYSFRHYDTDSPQFCVEINMNMLCICVFNSDEVTPGSPLGSFTVSNGKLTAILISQEGVKEWKVVGPTKPRFSSKMAAVRIACILSVMYQRCRIFKVAVLRKYFGCNLFYDDLLNKTSISYNGS